jgi:hypothetical protein
MAAIPAVTGPGSTAAATTTTKSARPAAGSGVARAAVDATTITRTAWPSVAAITA